MDFTDDLGLIDRDITLFREDKAKYWMNKNQNDNNRMYVNSQLKSNYNEPENVNHVNPVNYHNSPIQRELKLVNSKKGNKMLRILKIIFTFNGY